MAKDGERSNALIAAYSADLAKMKAATEAGDITAYRGAREDAKASLADLIEHNMQWGAE